MPRPEVYCSVRGCSGSGAGWAGMAEVVGVAATVVGRFGSMSGLLNPLRLSGAVLG